MERIIAPHAASGNQRGGLPTNAEQDDATVSNMLKVIMSVVVLLHLISAATIPLIKDKDYHVDLKVMIVMIIKIK